MKAADAGLAEVAQRIACRPSSMSMVISRPPVFERAHAIQMPERPVEVPISSARR